MSEGDSVGVNAAADKVALKVAREQQAKDEAAKKVQEAKCDYVNDPASLACKKSESKRPR